jgi:hypothetical protein
VILLIDSSKIGHGTDYGHAFLGWPVERSISSGSIW